MRLISTVAFAFALLVAPAFAQSEEDVLASIENLHGQSEAFSMVFGQFQDAFLFNDPTSIADLAYYPLDVAANGELYELAGPQDLIDNFDTLLTQETIDGLSSQDYNDLIVTSDGVGFANGALWMSLVCDDVGNECAWGIIRINNQ